jgi:hypothetical protein
MVDGKTINASDRVRKAYYTNQDSVTLTGITVSVNGQEYTGNVVIPTDKSGTKYKIDKNAYSLVGWYQVDPETETLIAPYDFSQGVKSNLILRAVWRSVGEYKVKYSVDGVNSDGSELTEDEARISAQEGSAPFDSYSYADTSSTSMKEAITSGIPEGYNFVGWYYDGKVYNPGDVFMIQSKYAVEETNSQGITEKVIYIYPVFVSNENMPVQVTQLTFHGNGGTTALEASAIATPANNEKATVAISDDKTEITIDQLVINENVPADTSNTYFTKTGYTFKGWAKSADATTPWIVYEDGKFKLNDADVLAIAADNKDAVEENGQLVYHNDLYAVWEKASFKVTVIKVVDSPVEADKETSFTFVPTFTKAEASDTLPTNVQANFSLNGTEGGNIKEFTEIPYGTKFQFAETENTAYSTAILVESDLEGVDDVEVTGTATGELTVSGNMTVTFTNTAKVFYVYHSGVKGGNVETHSVTESPFNLVETVTENTLYGGYYLKSGISAPAEIDDSTPAYDGSNWTWIKPETAVGTAITPVADTTYYLKEVPATYLIPTQIETFNRYNYALRHLILTTAVDDTNYKEMGFAVDGTNTEGAAAEKMQISFGKNSGDLSNTTVDLDVKKITSSSVEKGLVCFACVFNYATQVYDDIIVEGKTNTLSLKPYWITPDGITVTGSGMRRIMIADKNSNSIIEVGMADTSLAEVTYRNFKSAITAKVAA